MRSFRTLDRRAGYSLSAFALLLAMVAPGLVPAFASADTLTDRSIALSDNSVAATNVTYEVKFTATKTADAFLVEFCDNSPLIGATCSVPSGFSTSGVTTADSGWTVLDNGAHTKFLVTKSSAIAADEDVDVTFTSIDNPDVANDSDTGFYARILTYTSANKPADLTALNAYSSTAPGTFEDTGGVALSINDTIGVSAAVRESMTFCVSAAAPTDGCGGTTAPSVQLGDPVDGLSGTVSENDASLYAQISTNAATGAVVNLKSNATGCGGLVRVGGANGNCDIKPALTNSDLVDNAAFFGLKLGTASGGIGTFQAATGSSYDTTHYRLDYVAGDLSGVTSAYGSPVLDTDSAPISNVTMPLTFGAAAAPNTPAGNYSATLSMIATGKY